MRLWRNTEVAPEGKYLVLRRDGTVPDWQWFVLGQRDIAAVAGLRGYADKAEELGYCSEYVADIRMLADEWEQALNSGYDTPSCPDSSKPYRTDDPAIIEKMRGGQ